MLFGPNYFIDTDRMIVYHVPFPNISQKYYIIRKSWISFYVQSNCFSVPSVMCVPETREKREIVVNYVL